MRNKCSSIIGYLRHNRQKRNHGIYSHAQEKVHLLFLFLFCYDYCQSAAPGIDEMIKIN